MFKKEVNKNPVIGAKMSGQLLKDFGRVRWELGLNKTEAVRYLVRKGIEVHDMEKK